MMEDILASASSDRSAYPLWVLFSVAQLKQTGDLRKSLPFYPDLNGEKYAPVFTDKDLAQRFVEENPEDTCELMPVEDLDRLCYILQLYQGMGVLNVGTDFSSRKFQQPPLDGQLRTIAIFLQERGRDAQG